MRHLISTLILLMLFGCGGDSPNVDPSVTPTTQSLVGNYSLSDIAGTAWVEGNLTDLSAANVEVIGSLNLDDQNFNYELVVTVTNATTTVTTFTKEGTYTINYTNAPLEGTVTMLTSSSVGTDDFTVFDKELFVDVTGFLGGGTYNAQETWLKESDTPVFP